MDKIKLFEDAQKKLEAIDRMAKGAARDKAYDKFYNGLRGWKCELFNKYCDAKLRNNEYIDFDDCPSEKEVPAFVGCLKECGISHITISSGWTRMIEKVWALCQGGCKIEGVIEINGRSRDRKTGGYDKVPAFLLLVE